jgi:5,10-methylene-tetrahydrofolate dehydrogenase/methenyl tetrahydrofolate cyclohydrolase
MQGKIGEFTVRTYTVPYHFNRLFFNFKVDIIPIEKERYKSLAKIFKDLNAIFEFEGILVEIEIDKTLSEENITKKLYAFADALKKENIKPTLE